MNGSVMLPILLDGISVQQPRIRHCRLLLDIRWSFKKLKVGKLIRQARKVLDLVIRHSNSTKACGREARDGEHVIDMELVPQIYDAEDQRHESK